MTMAAKTGIHDMVSPPADIRYVRKPELTISQDDRVDQIAALHAAMGLEIEMAGAIQKIETLLEDHQTTTT